MIPIYTYLNLLNMIRTYTFWFSMKETITWNKSKHKNIKIVQIHTRYLKIIWTKYVSSISLNQTYIVYKIYKHISHIHISYISIIAHSRPFSIQQTNFSLLDAFDAVSRRFLALKRLMSARSFFQSPFLWGPHLLQAMGNWKWWDNMYSPEN